MRPRTTSEQVAYLGLLKAIDRYDAGRGPFVRYAVPNIMGELKRHFRDKGWGLHVPRSVQERVLVVNRATDTLSGKLGRSPSPRDLAEHTGLTLEEVLEALDAASAYTPAALDAPQPGGDGEGERTLGDTLGGEDAHYELVELGEAIAPAFQALPEREQVILQAALHRRPHPVGDRRDDRRLPDARVAAAAPVAEPAQRRRALGRVLQATGPSRRRRSSRPSAIRSSTPSSIGGLDLGPVGVRVHQLRQHAGDGQAAVEAVEHPRVDVRRAAHRRRVAQVAGDLVDRALDRSLAGGLATPWRPRPMTARASAASTVAFQVRKSLAEKSPPAASLRYSFTSADFTSTQRRPCL